MRLVTVGPLAFAVMLCALVVIARYADRVDRALSRIAIRLFGSTVDSVRGGAGQASGVTSRTGSDDRPRLRVEDATVRRHRRRRRLDSRNLRDLGPPRSPLDRSRHAAGGAPGPARVPRGHGRAPVPVAGSKLVVLFCGSALTLGAVAAMPPTGSGGGIQGTSLMPAPDGSRQGYPRWSLLSTRSRGAAWRSVVVRVVADQQDTYGEAAAEFSVALGAWTRSAPTSSPPSRRWGGARPARSSASSAENLVSVLQSGQGTLVVPRATVSGLPRGRRIPAGERSRSAQDAWPKPMSRCWSRGRSF